MSRFILKITQFVIVFTLLLFSFISNAQELENSLLWKISGKNITQPSYLFGTMHLICNPSLNEKTIKALDETSQLYLEIDIDSETNFLTEAKNFFMEDNKSIKNMVSKEDYERLNTFFKKYMSVTIDFFDNVRPINITYLLYPFFLECETDSIENELLKVTSKQNEQTFGLESEEEHNKFFEILPYESQIEELLELTYKDENELKEEAKQMGDVYWSENIEQMYKESVENEEDIQFKNALLNERNKKWIPVIEKAILEKPTFFGFGAAHLAGEEGVIKLLRKQGYKVEPVK